MTEWFSLLEKMQSPALILASFVIFILYKLLRAKDELFNNLASEVNETGKSLAKIAALLDLVCAKWLGGGK